MKKEDMYKYLIDYLLNEREEQLDYSEFDLFKLYRSLVNTRDAKEISNEFLSIQNELLNLLINEKGIINYKDYKPVKDNIYLIKGDITLLNTDGIVNAANKYMLGCFVPCHGCIDNAIHTFSGVQLRNECSLLMKNKKEVENGLAIITESYNLPSNKIIHTVGPIVYNEPTYDNIRDLRKCYQSILECAIKNNMESIAICCISTGEFGYPNEDAAIIALEVINEFLKHNKIDIILNVFKEIDYEIYERLLSN